METLSFSAASPESESSFGMLFLGCFCFFGSGAILDAMLSLSLSEDEEAEETKSS